MKDFKREKDSIINKFLNSTTTFFRQKRYGIKGCTKDECYDYNLIKYELLQWEIVKDDTSYIPIPDTNEYIYWGYFEDDPFTLINNSGTEDLQFQKLFINNPSIYHNLDFTDLSNQKYLVLKEPVKALIKNEWFNTSFNYGTMP